MLRNGFVSEYAIVAVTFLAAREANKNSLYSKYLASGMADTQLDDIRKRAITDEYSSAAKRNGYDFIEVLSPVKYMETELRENERSSPMMFAVFIIKKKQEEADVKMAYAVESLLTGENGKIYRKLLEGVEPSSGYTKQQIAGFKAKLAKAVNTTPEPVGVQVERLLKKGRTPKQVSGVLGLTKMQVAAFRAHLTMETYKRKATA
jgi:hypothetical protein